MQGPFRNQVFTFPWYIGSPIVRSCWISYVYVSLGFVWNNIHRHDSFNQPRCPLASSWCLATPLRRPKSCCIFLSFSVSASGAKATTWQWPVERATTVHFASWEPEFVPQVQRNSTLRIDHQPWLYLHSMLYRMEAVNHLTSAPKFEPKQLQGCRAPIIQLHVKCSKNHHEQFSEFALVCGYLRPFAVFLRSFCGRFVPWFGAQFHEFH